jgi:WD40 repeat protein
MPNSPTPPHLPTTFVHEFKDPSPFGTAGSARALAFAADSRLLALGGSRPTVDLWDTHEARQVAALSGHRPSKLQGTVLSLAFSPDGLLLASGGQDGTIRLWRAADGECVNVLGGSDGGLVGGSNGGVERLAFSPAAPVIAAADKDSARLFDLPSGAVLPARLPEGGVNGLAFTPDGSLLAVALGGREKKGTHPVVLANPADGSVVHSIGVGEGDFLARSLAFSPDGRLLAIAPRAGAAVQLWDTATWQVARTLKVSAHTVYELAFSLQGALGAAVGDQVCLWDPATDAAPVAAKVSYRRTFEVETLAFSPDGQCLATCRKGLSVRIYR